MTVTMRERRYQQCDYITRAMPTTLSRTLDDTVIKFPSTMMIDEQLSYHYNINIIIASVLPTGENRL